ncbi:MAG: hypothetical protein PHN39_02355 [Candidatus Pacebacteria bacterium]|nr:hypothetical protein [Candidatus Paceibacterota bacterium]
MTYQYFQKTLESFGLPREEMEELQYLVFSLPNDRARERALLKLTQNPDLLSAITNFIKKKARFVGEINEPGWDKIMAEQKTILKFLQT